MSSEKQCLDHPRIELTAHQGMGLSSAAMRYYTSLGDTDHIPFYQLDMLLETQELKGVRSCAFYADVEHARILATKGVKEKDETFFIQAHYYSLRAYYKAITAICGDAIASDVVDIFFDRVLLPNLKNGYLNTDQSTYDFYIRAKDALKNSEEAPEF